MSDLVESLERHEHAAHAATGAHETHGMGRGAQWTALLVAALAAGLAVAEQGARHAEIRVQQRAIDATDAWQQYQAKSTRATVARDVAALTAVIDVGPDPAAIARREALVTKLRADAEGYDHDPKDGRDVIAHRAHDFEQERDHATEQMHSYHNGSASFQLGIVLATASAIMRSRVLVVIAAGLGVAGIAFAVLGYMAPAWGAF